MAIELKLTTVKPDNIEWWWMLYPEKMTAIDTYMRAQDGFVSYSSEMKGTNSRVQIITFREMSNLITWNNTLYRDCPEAKERREYNDSNDIVTIHDVSETTETTET